MAKKRKWTIRFEFTVECDPIHVYDVQKELEKAKQELLIDSHDFINNALSKTISFDIIKDEIIKA